MALVYIYQMKFHSEKKNEKLKKQIFYRGKRMGESKFSDYYYYTTHLFFFRSSNRQSGPQIPSGSACPQRCLQLEQLGKRTDLSFLSNISLFFFFFFLTICRIYMYLYVPAGISDFFSPFFYCYDYALLSIFLLFRLRGFLYRDEEFKENEELSCVWTGGGLFSGRGRTCQTISPPYRSSPCSNGWMGRTVWVRFFFFLFFIPGGFSALKPI